jgi:hypothetical protein
LKVLADDLGSSPEFVERFRREGRLQAALDHPHTVTVYEAGESEHGLYLAMRLVPGPTLAVRNQERALDAARGRRDGAAAGGKRRGHDDERQDRWRNERDPRLHASVRYVPILGLSTKDAEQAYFAVRIREP